MAIRPMSAISDLTDEIQNLLDEALGTGLEIDQVEEIARAALEAWAEEATAAVAHKT